MEITKNIEQNLEPKSMSQYNPDKILEKSDNGLNKNLEKYTYNPDKIIEKSSNDLSNSVDEKSYNPDNIIKKEELSSLENRDNNIEPEKEYSETEEIQKLKEDYIDDVINKSEYPETIDKDKAMSDIYKKTSPEETKQKRDEYESMKNQLRNEWEKINGQPWPTYKNDVYGKYGNIIRRKGERYDLHHITPLGLGGQNIASNITPLSINNHQEVHAKGSPYKILEYALGE